MPWRLRNTISQKSKKEPLPYATGKRQTPEGATQKCKESVTQMRILYNPDFKRWEVYPDDPIIRNNEPQPVFVNRDYFKCELYRKAVEGEE